MARKVFNFAGINRGKFLVAGANYVRKPLKLNKDTVTLVSYIENNFAEVCEDSLGKGFCNGQCKNCPIQGAHDQALVILATQPKKEMYYHISNCRTVTIFNEPCAKDRGVRKEDFDK